MVPSFVPSTLLVLLAISSTGHAFVAPSPVSRSARMVSSRLHIASGTSGSGSSSQNSNMPESKPQNVNDFEADVSTPFEVKLTERVSLDISQTVYVSTIKTPADAYTALAEKGAANAKMPKSKIFHQSVLGGCYVGFGGLVSLCVAGGLAGMGAANPGIPKMVFAALFPVNLLMIVTTGGQLFTGNSAAVAAARWEGLVTWRQLHRSWFVSIAGNVVGCTLFAVAAWYVGLLKEGTAALLASTALNKCRGEIGPTIAKAVLCNWMVSLAVFLAGASNALGGKLIAVWFPISTFVAIGLEHSVANMFILPAALLIGLPLTVGDVVFRNVIPALFGNAIAGALVVAGSYAFQFGKLGRRVKK